MSYLKFCQLTKSFPGVRALDSVSFEVESGSVHALCGENGAGKSTLLKILSGVYIADEGHLELNGSANSFSSAKEAIDAGISVIYQELNLVREISIAENIWLGHLPNQAGIVSQGELTRKTKDALELVGLDIDPHTKVGDLPIAHQQMVEIAKALSHDAQVIAFDEPTSSLSTREVEILFELIKKLKDEGKAIIYVSHRMDEVTTLCDQCTVLKDGKHIETFTSMEGVTDKVIINRMVGRSIEDVFGYVAHEKSEGGLECKSIFGPGLSEPINLSVKKGEIVGLYGLVGAGRTELLKAIYVGLGEISIDGSEIKGSGPLASINAGLVFCPEDRKHEGIFPVMSVQENMNISLRRKTSFGGFVLNKKAEKENAQKFVEKLRVKTPELSTLINTLSGGNQQKVILGRWLGENVRAILLDEPTRGIDVGAKSEIYEIIRGLSKQGIPVVIVSSELPEVLGVSDRIVVMAGGRVVGELTREEATEQKVAELAFAEVKKSS